MAPSARITKRIGWSPLNARSPERTLKATMTESIAIETRSCAFHSAPYAAAETAPHAIARNDAIEENFRMRSGTIPKRPIVMTSAEAKTTEGTSSVPGRRIIQNPRQRAKGNTPIPECRYRVSLKTRERKRIERIAKTAPYAYSPPFPTRVRAAVERTFNAA